MQQVVRMSKVHHHIRQFALHTNRVITYLTDRTGHEAKGYPGAQPAVF